jgi:Flp pilus assembly protein TadB
MVPIVSLWLPVLLSAVFVFIVSSIIHMVFTYHYKDFRGVQEEEKLMDAIRPFGIAPGEYVIPYAGSPSVRKSPDFQERMKKGPTLIMSVWESGSPSMAGPLIQWFVYLVVVGIISAYVAGRALGPGAEYLAVFRFVGVTAFISYSLAQWSDSIWYKRSWGRTVRGTIDGLIYGLVTAGTFGWLWPAA